MNLPTASSQKRLSLGECQQEYPHIEAPIFPKSLPRQHQDRAVRANPWLQLIIAGVVLASGFSFVCGAILFTQAWTTGIGRVAGIEGAFRR